MTEKESIELIRKDIQDSKNEIIWILKAIMFFGLVSISLILIFSIFGVN